MKLFVLIILSLFLSVANANSNFNTSFYMSTDVINHEFYKIVNGKYIYGMLKGSLPETTRQIYLSQDFYFLEEYISSLNVLEKLVESKDKSFIKHLIQMAKEEKEMETKQIKRKATNVSIPAARKYIYFIHKAALTKDPAKIAASLYPCMWVYYELANYLRKNKSRLNNSHWVNEWIEEYSTKQSNSELHTMENLIDRLSNQNEREVNEIQAIILNGLELEYSFFEGAAEQSLKI